MQANRVTQESDVVVGYKEVKRSDPLDSTLSVMREALAAERTRVRAWTSISEGGGCVATPRRRDEDERGWGIV